MTQFFIADDHATVRMGISGMIKEMPGFTVAAEAVCGGEVLEKVQTHSIDLVIMDISMPGRSGLETLEDLEQLRKKPAVLIYTMHEEDDMAVRAIRLGAAGYLTKASSAIELAKAITTIARGDKYVSGTLGRQLATYVESPRSRPLHETLSVREDRVIRLIVEGKSLTNIGRELGVSAKTVTSYRARILKKMGMKSNADMVRYWVSLQPLAAFLAALE